MIKDLFKILIFSIFFSVVIYFINYNFFLENKKNIENNIATENFIEQEKEQKQENKKQIKLLTKKEIEKIADFYKEKKQENIFINYYPEDFRKEINFFAKKIKFILEKNIFKNKISTIDINLIKQKIDRRGKMKNKTIFLFGLKNNLQDEYLAVFTHEFAHYIDLYFLEKKVFFDISYKFYDISWQKTKIKKLGQKNNDFVSGYAMTNKYEDFAETFTYYVLHNKDFLEKTKKSKFLKQKYDFFSDYIFKNKEFFATNFSTKNHKIKNYYRDITKIDLEEKKLFSYLQKLK